VPQLNQNAAEAGDSTTAVATRTPSTSVDGSAETTLDSRPNILIVGCSGHARVVIDIVERAGKYRILGLIDSYKNSGTQLLGYEVIGTEEDIPMLVRSGVAPTGIVAIGDNWSRARIVTRIRELQEDFQFLTAVHPSSCVARDVIVGEGTVIMAGVVVNTGSKIGPFCIMNTSCSVDHDCNLGEYSSLAPGVVTGGQVVIGAFSAIGIGATVIHRVQIGEQTVIGAGATVTKDIADHVVAYGTPARVIRARQPGDSYLGESANAKAL
jgi:sugar O-acyltransferase (sialic acid O-acetyltransferase NeuD family)